MAELMAESIVLADRIALEVDGQLALLTLNRPAQMNPIDWDTIRALHATMKEVDADPGVRVVAIIGAGDAFSAGGDLKKYIELQRSGPDFRAFLEDLHALFSFIEFGMSKPVVALINGVTAAGGLELVLSCDVVYAIQGARIGDGHQNFGQMGGGGVLTRLSRRVFQNLGREVMFTGAFLPAEQWVQPGLVNRILADRASLIAEAERFATSVAAKSPLAISNMKRVANAAREMPFEKAIAHEIDVTHDYCLNSQDAPEGLAAFSEKRKPRFVGA
jgi:enoyl-CoA hydratase/carnithine racemase